ncbi:MAG: hypothetical protein ACYCYN_05890 [Solirubrobacteraceae bacterium]
MADREAEVYRAVEQGVVFGCVYGGKHHWLGVVPTRGSHEEGFARARHFVLAGAMAAFESYSVGRSGTAESCSQEFVEVVDLATGRVVHRAPTGTPPHGNNSCIVGTGSATSIVVERDGAVAWIAKKGGQCEGGDVCYEVHRLQKSGEQVLAVGRGVAPASLALAGSTIYWTNEGRPESASLE